MPEGEELQNLAEFFRVFGDSTRIRILYALSQSELCVCDIASLLGMGQSAISHQLRILKQMRLVKFRREGKSVLYSLADGHIQTILAQGMEHIGEKIMKFTKMQGIGNDYVYVNCFEETVEDPCGTAKMVSDRHFGIGSDGLIFN